MRHRRSSLFTLQIASRRDAQGDYYLREGLAFTSSTMPQQPWRVATSPPRLTYLACCIWRRLLATGLHPSCGFRLAQVADIPQSLYVDVSGQFPDSVRFANASALAPADAKRPDHCARAPTDICRGSAWMKRKDAWAENRRGRVSLTVACDVVARTSSLRRCR